jgi:hypothetical protein
MPKRKSYDDRFNKAASNKIPDHSSADWKRDVTWISCGRFKRGWAGDGGIADGKGILAALSLGAGGVCMGTRFLMSKEANINPIYQEIITNASENDTIHVQRLFNLGWGNAPHRVIKNRSRLLKDMVFKSLRLLTALNRPRRGSRIDFPGLLG